MDKKEEKKKESALNINNDFDFNFAKKLPKILRWILVIPIGILSILAVQLAYGFIVSMFLKNFSETSVVVVVVNAIFGLAKFYIFLIAMVAMAPVTVANKFKTGIGLSIIPFALAGGIIFLAKTSPDYDYSFSDMIIQIVVTVLAVIFGLIYIKKEAGKEKIQPVEQESLDSL